MIFEDGTRKPKGEDSPSKGNGVCMPETAVLGELRDLCAVTRAGQASVMGVCSGAWGIFSKRETQSGCTTADIHVWVEL